VKEDEVDGEEQTQKTKGKKRKAQSILARWPPVCPPGPDSQRLFSQSS
jgi:hypothetical protein